jgi:hypothetical protein
MPPRIDLPSVTHALGQDLHTTPCGSRPWTSSRLLPDPYRMACRKGPEPTWPSAGMHAARGLLLRAALELSFRENAVIRSFRVRLWDFRRPCAARPVRHYKKAASGCGKRDRLLCSSCLKGISPVISTQGTAVAFERTRAEMPC